MPRLSRPRAPRFRHGFTLVELLISLAMLGVVGMIVINVTVGQERLFRRMNDQMRVRHDLRTALNLVPVDVRNIATAAGDLEDFTDQMLTFRAALGTSVVCARAATDAIDLLPEAQQRDLLTSWSTPPQAGDTAWIFDEGTSDGAEDDAWRPALITDVRAITSPCPGSPFLDPASDAGRPGTRITVHLPLPDSLQAGAPVRFTRSTRYALERQPSGRWYLSRREYVNGGWVDAAVVSGPYTAPDANGLAGVRFAYYDSTGSPITDPSQARQVARIDLAMRGTSVATTASATASAGTLATTDSIAFRMALRNRQ